MAMFRSAKKRPEHLRALDQVREWTRDRFNVPEEATILVSEIACTVPGCPPVHTVVVFWAADKRYEFKIFKPVEDVVHDDLPFAWLKDALAAPEGFECDCC
jgi:hypothetical protein